MNIDTNDLKDGDRKLPITLSSGEHLRAIIDTVPDAMVVIDTEGRILAFSAGAEKMFGYSEAELLGENVSTLMPSPDRERHDGYISAYLETGIKRIIGIGRLTTARRRSGGTFPIDLSIGEARIGKDRVFAGFIRDLTESEKTEQRLHGLQAELAHVSRISAMGTLATSIAHELNQPLTAIVNYVETCRDMLDDHSPETIATLKDALSECASETMRAGQIVRRLRDFISRGEMERQVVSLSRIVNEASALALVNGDSTVEVEVDLERDVDLVLADRIQIQQVILNLLRNAVEAMENSRVRRIQIVSERAANGFVQVTIADSGPGLDAKVAERLFHPFVSTKASGMGLGLSICHTIVNGHGGKIWAEPSPLGGTSFHFTLIDAEQGSDDAE
ncbi:MAG: PAS domain S-box protein [Sphingomonadaceae bacterium]|nr:PAS domain S-box protein [Sphingomonadaceae bacterium]